MDYFDALHCNGWLADPTDRVRVVAIHEAGCSGEDGCSCVPRLDMRPAGIADIAYQRSKVVAGPWWFDLDAVRVG